MFEINTHWWEPSARAILIYAVMLILVRISGRRTVGQFTPFDLLIVMLLSESVSTALNGSEKSVTGGLLAAATLVIVNIGVAFVTSRSERVRTMVEGYPVLIGRDAAFFIEIMNTHRIPLTDALQALRESDCELKDMKAAVLETDGQISILKDSTCRDDDLRADPKHSANR